MVASFTAPELSPACWNIRIGVVVESDSVSIYSEDDLGSSSSLSLLSHFVLIIILQCALHLSEDLRDHIQEQFF